MKDRLLSSTTYPMTWLMVLASDHITPATGLSPAVTISKNGATFAAPSGAVTEVGNGFYALAGHATDRNALGDFRIHATAATADPSDEVFSIVAYDPFTASLGLSLAKGTNITGLNDIAATAIVSAGAITTSGGKVSGVILADTVTTYTGNIPQTGDSFARLGVNGAGLTAIGDTRLTNLDAAISSRSTLTDVQVWSYATRILTAGTNIETSGLTADQHTALLAAAAAAAKLTSTLELNGSIYRFTAPSLINSPSSTGAFSADDRATLDDIAAKVITGAITVQSPVSVSGDVLTIFRNDDYSHIEGRSIDLTDATWPVLDGTVLFKMGPGLSVAVDADITAPRAVRVELVPAHTAGLVPKEYSWELEATQANGHKITLVYGKLKLLADL